MVSYKRLGEGWAVPQDRRDEVNKVEGYFWQKRGTGSDLILGKHNEGNTFNFVVVL